MNDDGEYDSDDEYVVIDDLTNGVWLDAAMAARVETILMAAGWDVEIRESRKGAGEAEGTYARKSDGTLQFLGCSIPEPEALTRAIEEAVNEVYSTPESAGAT